MIAAKTLILASSITLFTIIGVEKSTASYVNVYYDVDVDGSREVYTSTPCGCAADYAFSVALNGATGSVSASGSLYDGTLRAAVDSDGSGFVHPHLFDYLLFDLTGATVPAVVNFGVSVSGFYKASLSTFSLFFGSDLAQVTYGNGEEFGFAGLGAYTIDRDEGSFSEFGPTTFKGSLVLDPRIVGSGIVPVQFDLDLQLGTTGGFADFSHTIKITSFDSSVPYSSASGVFLTGLSAIPLPSSAPMFGAALLGLAGLGYAAKRKKDAAAAV